MRVQLIELLLQADADPNSGGWLLWRWHVEPPIVRAAKLGLHAIVRLLLEHGAEVSQCHKHDACQRSLWKIGRSQV